MRSAWMVCAALFIGTASIVDCIARTALDFPNPHNSDETDDCHATYPMEYFCDPDQALDDQTAGFEINKLLREFAEREMNNCNCNGRCLRLRMTVVLLQEVYSSSNTIAAMAKVRDFTRQYFNKISSTDSCSGDLLLVYSVNDHIIYELSAAHAEKIITDQFINRTLWNAQEFFGRGRDVARGIRQVIFDITQRRIDPKFTRERVPFYVNMRPLFTSTAPTAATPSYWPFYLAITAAIKMAYV